VGAAVIWMLSLLPTTGCGSLTFTSLPVGIASAFVNIPAVVTLFAAIIGLEVALQGFRVAMFAARLLKL
jgi:hypothetical protein